MKVDAAKRLAMRTPLAVALIVCCTAIAGEENIQATDWSKPVDGTRLPTGREIRPAGDLLSFYGRPVDLGLTRDGRTLLVKDWRELRIVDVKSFDLSQSLAIPGGASLHGMAVGADGEVYVTNAASQLHVYSRQPVGDESGPSAGVSYRLSHSVDLPADSFPCGVALSSDATIAYVCLSKANSLAVVDLLDRKVTSQIPVGVAPYDVVLDQARSMAYVSNMGGRCVTEQDQTAPSAGAETVVDERGVASSGTVSQIDLKSGEVRGEVETGLQPSALLRLDQDGKQTICVANANNDTLSLLSDDMKSVQSIVVKPDNDLLFGSMPNALATSRDGAHVFVALAGNNAIAVLANERDAANQSRRITIAGLLPTAWFPGAVKCNDTHLFVANVKGLGSRSSRRPDGGGRNSHDHQAIIQKVPLQSIDDVAKLTDWTETVTKSTRIAEMREAMRKSQIKSDAQPVPIPENLGEPSVFNHVIYVIKENRTFDQVFGDFDQARSDENLCIFPEKITPNHHALAERFGILDNYYCNGVLSADGHSWATEGNVTPYLERAFGGFTRSYTFGDDPITYSSSGFVWDHVLAAGLSFRNYGEMDYASIPGDLDYQGVWDKYQAGERIEFDQRIGIDRLQRYSSRDYPGWNMSIPDVLRMDRFLEEFGEFEKDGGLPNVSIVYLPQDHLGGGVTSRAHMADNDLAVGRLVEAISRSRYWKDTLILVNEDDPQNGYDHIDGHRSICLVASAYSKPGVNHHFYNQSSVLRTLLHIFGLPPMNQQVASAPLLTDCFAGKADLTPYEAIEANFPLNESPQPASKQSSTERNWRRILATVPIERTGMKTEQDEDNLNRFVWHDMRGWQTPYPTEWSGAHGRGLKKFGLTLEDE